MSDQLIIPALEEAAAKARELAAAEFVEFLAQWDMESMPACPAGMLLLKELHDAHPSVYEMARQRSFLELSHPAFRMNARATAFVQHRNTCGDCNESGDVTYPYRGAADRS